MASIYTKTGRVKTTVAQLQEQAVAHVRRFVERQLHNQTITSFEIKGTDYGVLWITVDVESTAAPGTLLHALDSQHWFFNIGKRGAITAHSGPRSYAQFKGQHTAHGITFAADGSFS